MNRIKVCYLKQGSNGVQYHRLQIPMNHMARKYKDLHITEINGFTAEVTPFDFDVIIYNRISMQPEPYIERAKEAGVKIILDLDDWVRVPEHSVFHNHIDTPIIEEKISENVENADAIWVVSEEILLNFVKYNPFWRGAIPIIVPNAIDYEQPQFQDNRQKQSKYTIGYIAGAGHHKDVEILFNPLYKLLPRKNYNILVAGYPTSGGNETYWNYISTIFTSGGQLKDSFMKIDEQSTFNYAFSYNLCDLMLAPLADNEFNRCKSNLKVLEAAAFNLPIICSNVEPYKEFIRQGLVYTIGNNMDKRINSLIKDPKPGIMMGKSLGAYCRENYNLEKINQN